jgi:HD superfamily phosphohydrolase
MSFVAQRIRDPLHNLIEFSADEFENAMWRVIQTRPFQRLRRIKQLGFTELVYPGATHTRFAHSLGVFQTARHLMRRIKHHQGDANHRATRAHRALAASLVHDVGHGPFSHAFEDVGKRLNLKMAKPEDVSDLVIRNSEITQALDSLGNGFSGDVADIIRSSGPRDIYCAVVSSQFDADRLDYMRRDRLMCGTQHGAIDYEWLVSNLEVGDVSIGVDEEQLGSAETFVLGPKALYAAESYLLGLFQLYPTVYFHKATRGAEKLYSELLIRVFTLALDAKANETGLPSHHPLLQFALDSNSLEKAQALDDFVFWGSLELMASASDGVVSKISRRLRDRCLYKSVEVFTPEVVREARQSEDKDYLNKVANRMKELLVPDGSASVDEPAILLDRVRRPLYREFDKSKGPLNQILIKMPDGSLQDVARVSPVIDAIGDFEGFRVYLKPGDTATRDRVTAVATEAIAYARSN